MTKFRKISRFLCSMRFALVLLALLTAACLAGSLIPQGQTAVSYTSAYPQTLAGLILALGLNDVFHSPVFLLLALALCLNLIFCNLTRFPALWKQSREDFTYEKRAASKAEAVLETAQKPDALFRSLGFARVQEPKENALYACKNKAGIWGAWLCHFGILILIVGFGLGQMYQFETSVYGIPGSTHAIADTGCTVTIEDFQIILREDETVDKYVTTLTATDSKGNAQQGTTEVNHPAKLHNLKFYQNSTGWGATLTVRHQGQVVQERFLCAGEMTHVEGLDSLHVMLRSFYPDFALDDTGMPTTRSSRLNNPGYLYTLYYGDQLLGMNTLTKDQVITVDEYTLQFHDPQPYTLLQIKRDPYEPVAAAGGGLILAALLLAFYCPTQEIWARREDDRWKIYIRSRKASQALLERLKQQGDNHVLDH